MTSPGPSTPAMSCWHTSADATVRWMRVLTEFPPLIEHFADQRDLFADAVQAWAG